MKVKTIVILVLVGSGCGPERVPDLISEHGVNSFFNGVEMTLRKETVDAMEVELVQRLVPYGYDPEGVYKALDGVGVDWEPGAWKCSYIKSGAIVDGTCAGQTFGASPEVAWPKDGCPGDSAYIHELTHALQLRLKNLIDEEHTLPEWPSVMAAQQCVPGF